MEFLIDSESPFTHNDVLDYLEKEMEKVGISIEKLLPWLMEPPQITTFRVNALKTTSQDVQELFESELQKTASERGVSHAPLVRLAPGLSDVLVIDSWNSQPRDATSAQVPKDLEIVVDASCGAAVLRGAHVFAPGVLAISKAAQIGDQVDIYADIEGKCLQGLAVRYPGRKRLVGCGEVKMARNQLFGVTEPPRGIAVLVTSTPSGCVSLTLPPELGLLQNLPSTVAVCELGPLPGETVLDMCAAPGNKTSHLATLMNNQGVLVALDRTARKAQQIRDNCQRLSAKCLVFAFDSTKAVAASIDPSRTVHQGPPFNPGTFDKVLLDAPCSALGQRPQLLNKTSVKQLKSYPPLQRQLFEAAVGLTRPGGEIVYSTCSVTHAENEGLVEWVLRRHADSLTLLPPRLRMTPVVSPPGDLPSDLRACVQRFGPPGLPQEQYWDSVGFFITRFRKKL